MAEIQVFSIIIALFIVVGTVIPFVQEAVSIPQVEQGAELVDNLGQGSSEESISAKDILLSILSMFFWTFGSVPWWLDMLLIVPRILLAVTIYRLVNPLS